MLHRLAEKARPHMGFVPPTLNAFEEQILVGMMPEQVAEQWAKDAAARNKWNELLTVTLARIVARRCARRRHSPFAICGELRIILEPWPL